VPLCRPCAAFGTHSVSGGYSCCSHRAYRVLAAVMGRGRDGESPGSSARDAPHDDVFAHAEALNDLSATYDVAIDGVPLTRLSTVELTKLAATRGLPLSHARHELIAAVAWDEMEKRDLRRVGKDKTKARADETNRRDAVHDKDTVLDSKAGSDKNVPGVVPKPSGMTRINTDTNARLNTASNARGYDEFNVSDEDDDIDIDVGEKENDEFPAPDSYLVGATAVVWEGELYTYGGLTPTGEFVSGILRWSGRGVNVEVQTNSHENPRDENAKTKNQTSPPGRYGHTAVVVHDGLWIFGGTCCLFQTQRLLANTRLTFSFMYRKAKASSGVSTTCGGSTSLPASGT